MKKNLCHGAMFSSMSLVRLSLSGTSIGYFPVKQAVQNWAIAIYSIVKRSPIYLI
ncbi:MAG: hypothetical protein M1G31_25555 [Pseudanabaena sp. Salubria-1]|nr:hypothetical protein [Pseudanabaena sp. Salubria-1]